MVEIYVKLVELLLRPENRPIVGSCTKEWLPSNETSRCQLQSEPRMWEVAMSITTMYFRRTSSPIWNGTTRAITATSNTIKVLFGTRIVTGLLNRHSYECL